VKRYSKTKILLSITLLAAIVALVSLNSCANDETPEPAYSFSSFSDFLSQANEIDSADLNAVAQEFLDTLDFPVIENNTTVYFVYQGEADRISLAGDINGWQPDVNTFDLLLNTDIWYLRMDFEHSDTRIDYKFVVDGNWRLDPLNPNRIAGGYGDNSELALPDYVQPWEVEENPDALKGTLISQTISSTLVGRDYQLRIYLPPGYDEEIQYPVAYFQDGSDYLDFAQAQTVMDNLIHQNVIRPIIGVFVIPNDRNEEYAFSLRFAYSDFFATELVSFIDSAFSTIPEAASRAVIGDSYGGNISAIVVLRHTEVFGNCGLHSAAFQPNNYEVLTMIDPEEKLDLRIANIYGIYEGSITITMRDMAVALDEENYDHISIEYPEGHSWGLWRATLDDMLGFFFPWKR
jgi:enterochelin esterase family protein